MVSEAQLVNNVECRKHRGSEVIELLRSCPMVSIRKHGEDNSKRIVALFFERQKKPLDALLRCRYHILIHLASAHCFVRLDEVNDIVRHLIVTSPRDVLHLVVDDDWCDVVLLLEDFTCLGGESCGGVGAGDSDNGCRWDK